MVPARAASQDPVRTAEAKVVYGTDDRIDRYAETDPEHLAWADATCAVISVNRVTDDEAGGYLLSTSAYLRSGKPACEGEPLRRPAHRRQLQRLPGRRRPRRHPRAIASTKGT
jgi:hypothetical protein